MRKSMHSICRWTFHPGKGGFVPGDSIPQWGAPDFDSASVARLVAGRIAPRMPQGVSLGLELHYDFEVDEKSAEDLAGVMSDCGVHLAMLSPGAHKRFAYGGPASPDPVERKAANDFCRRGLELMYGPLRRAWHPDAELAPTYVLWNGSWGYDLALPSVRTMYSRLKESVADLCRRDEALGASAYVAIEPKPNEGHPALMIPTVASALLFWRKLEEEFGIPRANKGVNKEFGHSEMIGLDAVYDTVEEIDDDALVHMHLNSQGLSDGITLGGPGKFDIDHGVRVSGQTVAVAALVSSAGYSRWKGHDMQPRPYDDERAATERVVRSVLAWEACAAAAARLDSTALEAALAVRNTIAAEDMMRAAVADAQDVFDSLRGKKA